MKISVLALLAALANVAMFAVQARVDAAASKRASNEFTTVSNTG